jgi:hypothetical protein
MQHPAIGHDDAKSAVTFREMRTERLVRRTHRVGRGCCNPRQLVRAARRQRFHAQGHDGVGNAQLVDA